MWGPNADDRAIRVRSVQAAAVRVRGRDSSHARSRPGGGVARGEGAVLRGEADTLLIPTLEGAMIANINDWIIKGVKGEIYPCKPDIFDMTYEPME